MIGAGRARNCMDVSVIHFRRWIRPTEQAGDPVPSLFTGTADLVSIVFDDLEYSRRNANPDYYPDEKLKHMEMHQL
jgi:hypothetical protein